MKIKKKDPKNIQANQIVDSITEAAARILNEESDESFTTNNIANLAGVSIGSLYHYFKNKENIIEELLFRKIISTINALLNDQIQNEINLDILAKTIVKAQFNIWRDRNILSKKLIRLAPKILDSNFLFESDYKMIKHLKKLLSDYQIDNIRNDNLDYSLSILINAVRMGIYHCLLYPETYKEEVMEEELVKLILGMLREN